MLVSRHRREISRASRKPGRVIGKDISLIGARPQLGFSPKKN
jgi:hypothetical protein